MENKPKITIPEPCHENWNKMTPKDSGRFCMSCSKTVVDFTSILPDEIQHFFIQNQNERICGRFRKSQLDSITIQIPDRLLYSQKSYSKMFLLALFLAMGTTLFSCQSKDGKKQKIDKVEVIKDTAKEPGTYVGKAKIHPEDSTQNLLPPPPKVDQVKFKSNPVITTKKEKTIKTDCKKVPEDNSDVVNGMVLNTNAEFPGGIDQFHTYFMKEYKKPEGVSYWKLNFTLAFAVEKNGTVSFLECSPAVEEPLEKEIIRVLNVCPKWQPGESNGRKIRMQYSVPILLK